MAHVSGKRNSALESVKRRVSLHESPRSMYCSFTPETCISSLHESPKEKALVFHRHLVSTDNSRHKYLPAPYPSLVGHAPANFTLAKLARPFQFSSLIWRQYLVLSRLLTRGKRTKIEATDRFHPHQPAATWTLLTHFQVFEAPYRPSQILSAMS